MRKDIHKLGEWLEKVCQDGIAVEQKLLEWKLAEEKKNEPELRAKTS